MELTFTLTLEEANTIVKALGKLPFEEVNNLIGKLNTQATPQLKPAETETVKEE
jgi:hypothetical protein